MKKWKVLHKLKDESIINVLLENRGIKTKKEIGEFLHPKLEDVTVKSVGIDGVQLKKALQRIEEAIKKQEEIVVFGDYDVDGICGAAILWETLFCLGARVMPYIPHRIDEGYGLSLAGISNVKSQMSNLKLIITVDNGIVANEAVLFANKQGIDVIITDHHVVGEILPKAYAIVHTTKLCGTGVAWVLAQEYKIQNTKYKILDHLALVALATVADLVPLTGANRTLLMHGLSVLHKTKRLGIVAICEEAGIDQKTIETYEIGHVIAPRLNAAGRIEHAMDALRLLCTKDTKRAKLLAQNLGATNRERQDITLESAQHAVSGIRNQESGIRKKLLFIAEEQYQQGVIGLVAGRLVEEFYRPAIVVSIGETHSKASARSIHGFNIIEFIRTASHLLIDAGGHPMAAGFTVETAKLTLLQKHLEEKAEEIIDEALLQRSLRIDCEIPIEIIDQHLYKELQALAPFGMKNPEPTFVSRNVVIEDMRLVGKDRKHVKFKFSIDAIGFGLGEKAGEFSVGDKVDIVYTIDENEWNGRKTLQLKVRDIKRN
ncbi:MAG: single-stranded-DNA-specific exonuclease RecJ [Candidatus Levyibacteriota bacterium]|nr:MAG: single-stranded-DNA-specific exonuclease RecJ [Candidatus Levybacteria bacterium]